MFKFVCYRCYSLIHYARVVYRIFWLSVAVTRICLYGATKQPAPSVGYNQTTRRFLQIFKTDNSSNKLYYINKTT